MGKDENSGVYTKREIPVHHKQNEADQIMETEEQREKRQAIYNTWWGISVKEKISVVTGKLKPIK